MLKSILKNNYLIIIIFFLLASILSLSTHFFGNADINDYTDTAKFFAGEYSAKLRCSHSILFGWIHAPLVKLFDSFIFFKIQALFWLFILVISVYLISNKNKKTLLLLLTSPLIWYMVPWMTPAFLLSLLFLWGYYFINKFEKSLKWKYLVFSGIIFGFAAAIWTTPLYLCVFLILIYLSNKKFYYSILFVLSILIGLLPIFLLDQIYFNFAFYSIVKHFFSDAAFFFYGGVYNQGKTLHIPSILIVVLFIPIYFFSLYKKERFNKEKKGIIFLSITLLFFLLNPQIRMLIVITPIIILLLGKYLTKKQAIIQIFIFLILSILVINPYLIQVKYETNGEDFSSFFRNINNLSFSNTFSEDLIKEDVNNIATEYPNELFVVGNNNEDYQELARVYWGGSIKEFVSIEDYSLFLENKTIIAEKEVCSLSKIKNRRDICISIYLRKFVADNTNYTNINYAISINEPLNLQGFDLEKKYNLLYLYKKSS